MLNQDAFIITELGFEHIGPDLYGQVLCIFAYHQAIITKNELKEYFHFNSKYDYDAEAIIMHRAIFDNTDSIVDELLSEGKLCKIN